jgi:hypothetical protein
LADLSFRRVQSSFCDPAFDPALRCRIRPYLDQGGAAARHRWRARRRALRWDARPARARRCDQTAPQINQAHPTRRPVPYGGRLVRRAIAQLVVAASRCPPGVASRWLRQPRPRPLLARGSAPAGSGAGAGPSVPGSAAHAPGLTADLVRKYDPERLNHPAARHVFRTGQVSPLAPAGRSHRIRPARTPAASRGQGRLSCDHHSSSC